MAHLTVPSVVPTTPPGPQPTDALEVWKSNSGNAWVAFYPAEGGRQRWKNEEGQSGIVTAEQLTAWKKDLGRAGFRVSVADPVP